MKAKLTARTVSKLVIENRMYEVWDTDISGFFLRVLPSGNKSYFLFYRTADGGKRNYRIGKAGSLTPEQARDVAKKKAGEIAKGLDIQAEKQAARLQAEREKLQTLKAFLLHKYEPWAVAELKTGARNVQSIRVNFAHLMSKPLDKITQWDVNKWRVEQKRKGKKPSSIHREVAVLKAAISKAVVWNVIDFNPLAGMKMEKLDQGGVVRYLNAAEEMRLRAVLDERERNLRKDRISANSWRQERGYPLFPDFEGDYLKPMIIIALNTGMRRGELFSLTWEAVSFEASHITVRGSTAKTAQTRYIPMNAEAIETLNHWREASGHSFGLVFPNREGARFDNISSSWAKVIKAAEVMSFRFHDLRHTFASKLVMNKVDLNTVRELMGHTDIKMTLRYAHLAPEHKAAAVATLSAPVNGEVERLKIVA